MNFKNLETGKAELTPETFEVLKKILGDIEHLMFVKGLEDFEVQALASEVERSKDFQHYNTLILKD